jgi:hypothetical protein
VLSWASTFLDGDNQIPVRRQFKPLYFQGKCCFCEENWPIYCTLLLEPFISFNTDHDHHRSRVLWSHIVVFPQLWFCHLKMTVYVWYGKFLLFNYFFLSFYFV